MTTVAKILNYKAWRKALGYSDVGDSKEANSIAQPAEEFPLTPLALLSGKIPEGLIGSLYRNGPARLERNGLKVGHWFDGDGAVLAVHFNREGATAVYCYVKTKGYLQENAADALLFPNYGMTAPGGFWNNWLKPVKNAANTAVLALPDKLLALWEGGKPHSLDLNTLETKGIDDLSGLGKGESFSAHPKVDFQTGNIYNFGVTPGLNATLNLYRVDRAGKIIQKNATKLNGLPLIHDFTIAGSYLIFFVSPVRVNLLPTGLGLKSFSDAMEWKPELGTEILIFDRNTLSLVSRNTVDPWYQWHYANGCVAKDGSLSIQVVRFPDFQTNQYLKEVATGRTQTLAKGTLWQIRLDPKTAKLIEMYELCDRGCEFPIVPRHQVGENWRYTYLSAHPDGVDISQELLSTILRYDRETGETTAANMEENCYASEPIYISHPHNSETGWILTVVYDGNSDRSEVRIYNSDRLDEEAICRLELPKVIPHSFHGTWKSNIAR